MLYCTWATGFYCKSADMSEWLVLFTASRFCSRVRSGKIISNTWKLRKRGLLKPFLSYGSITPCYATKC